MKLGWKGALGLFISAFLIWWTLRGVSLPEVWEAVRAGNLWLLAAAVLVTTSSFLIRAIRWKLLLQPIKPDTSLDSRFGAVTIAFMANNLLPARMGEVVRAFAFAKMESIPVSSALGSVVVERFLDGLTLLVFLLLPTFLPGFPLAGDMGVLGALIRVAAVSLVTLSVLFAVMLIWPALVLRTAQRVLAHLPPKAARHGLGALQALLDSLRVLRRPGLLLPALALSFVHWAWNAFSKYLAMAAFGIHLGWTAAMFTEAVVGWVVALPSAPGFFGTFHQAAKWSLTSVYGVEPARTLAFAYGLHLGGFIPVTLIGLWYAHRIGLSLRELGRKGVEAEETP